MYEIDEAKKKKIADMLYELYQQKGLQMSSCRTVWKN